MAIKVKHEGNVTSRVYASAAGGKGKRQAEDARVLASMQRGGMGGGGGTGGGARAGGSAPTLSAPTSHAALGSTGSLIGRSNTFAQQKELQKQQEDAILARQKDEQTWKTGENNKELEWKTKENQKEIDARAEQGRLTREARQKELEDERVWKEEQERKKLQQAASYQEYIDQGYSPKQAFELVGIDEDIAENEKNALSTDAEKDKALRADALNQFLEKKKSIIPHRKPKPDPNDPAQSIREVTLSDGRKVQMMRDARGNWTEYVPDRSKMTAQEIWDSAFVAPDGTRWIQDGKGGIVPLQNTATSEAKPDLQRAKYIASRVAELTNVDSEANMKKVEAGGKLPTREEAEQIAMREYDVYSGVGPSPSPSPSPTPTPNHADGGEGTNFDYSEDEELAEAKRRGLIK
jgi:hypothetical protein